MKNETELLVKATEIADLPDPVPVIFGLLKEIEILRSDQRRGKPLPTITHIPVGELF